MMYKMSVRSGMNRMEYSSENGVQMMYPNELYYYPYGQQSEYQTSTIQPENDYNDIYDERQFGPMFPS